MIRTLLRMHWSAIREDCRSYWGKLTVEDLNHIDGEYDAFVAALRRRYGYSSLKAEDELERFLFRYSESNPYAAEVGTLVDVQV